LLAQGAQVDITNALASHQNIATKMAAIGQNQTLSEQVVQ
jgi:hypothetical protein